MNSNRFLIAAFLWGVFLLVVWPLGAPANAQGSQSMQGKPAKKAAPLEMPADLLDYFKSSMGEEEFSPEEARFRLDRFDLNGDGFAEYFVVGYCSAVGNCQLWVFEKTRSGYNELLTSPFAHVVCARSTRTKGYLDVEVASHGSAFDSSVSVFKFDGVRYDVTEGYDLRWEYDEKTQKTRQVEGPRRRAKCRELFTRYVNTPRPPRTKHQ